MAIFSTLWTEDEAYNEAVTVLDYRKLGMRGLARAMAGVDDDSVLIVNGALGYAERWRDEALLVVLRRLGHRPKLVVSDATWEPRSVPEESSAGVAWRINRRLGRRLVSELAGPGTVFCFLSRTEVSRFLDETGLPPGSAVFTPFLVTVFGEDQRLFASGPSPGPEPYAFTGGNTLRDWPLLIDALAAVPFPVRVATHHVHRAWPQNFVVGPVPPEDFFAVAAGARAGVVTLRTDVVRSAGQQTYLNLLRTGVPVVVNDAPGVIDHLAGVPSAFVTAPSDPEEIRARVCWLMDEANAAAVAAVVGEGQRVVDREFGEAAYYRRLVELARALGG